MNFIPSYKNSFRILKGGKISLVVSSFLASTTLSFAAPSGGVVTSGSANISQNGKVTDITQTTQKASINWNKFNIASDETVNFKQPNSSSITLNRVVGNEKSIINGALNANGQVWIINSNGVLFGKGASINTSGLLATTKDISDSDFQAGNYKFTGNSKESVINLGTIDVVNNGSVILAANEVKNEGSIKAIRGKIHLAGADEYTVNLNGNSLVNLIVNKGVLDALVKNSGTIIANGGEVYLTTNAVNELLKGVVNNTGVIEANSLAGITGHVELFAHGGSAKIDGTIDASGGFIETSGNSLHVEDSTVIKTKTWLLDPDNIIIESSGGGVGGESVSATAIQNALSTADIELQATNDITVNENITWATDKKLTLTAGDEIYVNATIENTNTTNGGVFFNAANVRDKVIFNATTGKVIIHNPYQLQWINQALNGKYELGGNIDASVTASWNGGKGWIPIMTSEVITDPMMGSFTVYYGLSGTFNGLGHTISNLTINDPTRDNVGFFGQTGGATVQNVGLVDVAITGKDNVGALIGVNNSISSIENAYATGSVSGATWVGGLVGINYNSSTIKNSYAIVTVSGTVEQVGGLVGNRSSNAPIINSYASGTVSGTTVHVGGLVGYYSGDTGGVTNSYYDNQANTGTMGDTGFGKTKAQLLALVTGGTWNNTTIWGTDGSAIEGYANVTLPFLRSVTKFDNTLFASGFGTSASPYTITNWTQLQNINNANILTKDYFFSLLNDLGATTTGYTIQVKNGATLANDGKGWNPIGYFKSMSDQSLFAGNFDGLGHTVKDLFINRPDDQFNGLFGYIDNSTIKNIGVVNANIQSNNIFGGVLAGGVLKSTIENAYSTGILNISVDDNYWGTAAGGLVGILNNSTINNSYSTVKTTGISKTGGLVGYLFNSSTINNSYATGEVTGTGNNIGGLVGSNTSSSVTKSFWDTQTSGQATSAAGVGKTTAQMKDKSTFDGWDIQEDSTIAKGTPFLAWQKSGNGYTKTWVIGTKGATPDSVDPKPQDTNKGVERIVRSIANQTATTVNLPNMETSTTPNNSGRNTDISFSQGENQMLVSRPIEGQATKRVSLSEARQMQIQNGGSGEEVIVPLSNSSIIQLVDGGVNLPNGVEQEFYLANANTQEEK